MDAEKLAQWAGGAWSVLPSAPISSVTQDSRAVRPGALYVALRGERFDGHDFVSSAFHAGASAALVDFSWEAPADVAGRPLLRVLSPAKALLALAKGYRASLQTFFLGVTGSAGKTTLKELTASMLSLAGETVATPGNKNNEIGLPLSILSIPPSARYAVIEAGISHPEDMDPLASTLLPDASVISSIGAAHIAFFGSERAIASEKAKLLSATSPAGFAVLLDAVHERATLEAACPCPVVCASLTNPEADYFGEPLPEGGVRVCRRGESAVELRTGLQGEHNVANALLAYATAREAGVTAELALAGLAHFKAPPMRWEALDVGSVHVINDAYNANPLSMCAALKTFAQMKAPAGKVVVLGDMLELGEESDALHYQVGEEAGRTPWKHLVAIGSASRALLEGACSAGFDPSRTAWFATTAEASEALIAWLSPGDTVLLKGSRGMRLEKIVEALRAR